MKIGDLVCCDFGYVYSDPEHRTIYRSTKYGIVLSGPYTNSGGHFYYFVLLGNGIILTNKENLQEI